MLISYNWLKEYVDIKLPPEKLAQLLTMSGLSVDYVKETSQDHIINIEITSNRPDWLSYIGVAREVAAITGRKLCVPSFVVRRSSFVKSERKTKDERRKTISIKIDDKELCARYTGRVITDVTIGESPAHLKTKLEAMGLKPVNNIVDITNFCLFETGEPMHAFDLDKISGGEIIVRRAKKNEKIVTIDGVERALDDSVLVIADKEKPIAIAGVMGGINTEVTASTKNILLEAAYFDPISIRRTSRKLGIVTESNYRFERKVDIENIVYSSNRALGLILELAGGSAGAFIDTGKKENKKNTVELRLSRLDKITGARIPKAKAEKILTALGLAARAHSKDKIKFEIPHFRNDLKNEVDLIEEVARVRGYDKIPTTIPVIVEQPTRRPRNVTVEKKIRRILAGLGAEEIITYGLVGKRILDMAALGSAETVEIKNPLTSEQEMMRPGLLAGMLNAISWNMNRKEKDLKLFELGNIYLKEEGGKFFEGSALSIGLTGQTGQNWNEPSRDMNFFDLKGMCEELLTGLGIGPLSLKYAADSRFASAASASIGINGVPVGAMGEIPAGVLNNFDIKTKVYFLEMNIGPLIESARLVNRFAPLPKYPSVFRDISIVVDKKAVNGDIMLSITAAAGALLKEVKLIDRYKGKQIPDDKIGLTYRLEYQDLKRTLEEKDVTSVHSKVLSELKSKFSATLR